MKRYVGGILQQVQSFGASLLAAPLLASCMAVITPYPASIQSSATLKSATLTRHPQARLEIDCSNALYYMVASQEPKHADSGWKNCDTATLEIQVPLEMGLNEIKVWFKRSGPWVSPVPTTFNIRRATHVVLEDPTPGTEDGYQNWSQGFGERIFTLSNGTILLVDPYDDSVATDAGALHIYDPEGTHIRSLYGSIAGEMLFQSLWGVVELPNGNILLSDSYATVNGLTQAGALFVLDGKTFEEIARIEGDNEYDYLSNSTPRVLSNGNFVILSPSDDVGGVLNAGSAILVNGTTGAEIARIEGTHASDNLGSVMMPLPNGNFVVIASNADAAGVLNAGSAFLVNGTTGDVIAQFSGNVANDRLGSSSLDLKNGNFLIMGSSYDVSGMADAGIAMLINGTTGAEIARFTGNAANDRIASSGATLLENGNFVIRSMFDVVGGIAGAGSYTYVNGTTGAVIATLTGDNANDNVGNGIPILLANGNIVFPMSGDDIGGLSNVGSVVLMNGTTGAVIARHTGASANDNFGSSILPLKNGDFLIRASSYDLPGMANAGVIVLVNGVTGAEIRRHQGIAASDMLGSHVFELQDGTLMVGAYNRTVGGLARAGSLLFINPATGALVAQIDGSSVDEYFGSGSYLFLPNGNIVITNNSASVNGLDYAGYALLIDGSSKNVIARYEGENLYDYLGFWDGAVAAPNNSFLVRSPYFDANGLVDSGTVRMIDGSSGEELFRMDGERTGDQFGSALRVAPSTGHFIVGGGWADHNGLMDSGKVVLVVND